MNKYKGKPYNEQKIEYFSNLNYNTTHKYLLEEDHILSSIDADLPTNEELIEQRKRYNKLSKEYERRLRKQHARSILTPKFICDNEISVWEDQYDIYVCDKDDYWVKWDRDTYEHFKNKKGFKFKHVPKF